MKPDTENMQPFGFDILVFDELESTNLFVVENEEMNALPEGTVVWAKRQTAGIGQSGNRWSSEAGKNLTFSIVLRPDFLAVQSQFELHKVFSVAVWNTLHEIMPQRDDIKIKWPNDIYVGTKKICGMLVNNIVAGNNYRLAVAGIGLNVNQTAFDPSLPNPTSLKNLTGDDFELFNILQKLLHNVVLWYDILKNNYLQKINKEYFANMLDFGERKNYRYRNAEIQATITGVDKFGRLQLQTADKQSLVCDIKEVQFII